MAHVLKISDSEDEISRKLPVFYGFTFRKSPRAETLLGCQMGGLEHEGGEDDALCKATKKAGKTPTWDQHNITGWWFQIFFIFIPTWGNDPI